MASDVEKSFEFWITQFPETHHPLDERRFYDFIEKAVDANEHIDKDWLVEHASRYKHNLTSEQLNDFGQRFEVIRDFLQDRKSA